MITVFIFTLVAVQTKAAPPFPQHLDLQKVGDVVFKAEKYNVLKASVHIIEDHFKNSVRRESDNIPSKRLLIDRNGFRHFWTGFEDEETDDGNLRKCEHDNIISVVNNSSTTTETANKITENVTSNNGTLKEITTQAQNENPNETNNAETGVVTSEPPKGILREGPTKKRRRKKNKALRTGETNPKEGKTRTVAHVTLFCPFLGVITMHRFLD